MKEIKLLWYQAFFMASDLQHYKSIVAKRYAEMWKTG